MDPVRNVIEQAYAAFNARDIDTVLKLMAPEVEWPNGMEGGWVHGHAGIREYWTRQWKLIDPHVEPVDFTTDPSGRIVVRVHQVVRDLTGNLVADRMVEHVYDLDEGFITRMEIREG